MKPIFKRMLSGVLSATMTLSAIPIEHSYLDLFKKAYAEN